MLKSMMLNFQHHYYSLQCYMILQTSFYADLLISMLKTVVNSMLKHVFSGLFDE